MQPDVVAQRAHARLALADAPQREPERRARQRAEGGPRERRGQQREVEERQRRRQAPGQRQVGARHARDAVVALGERDPAEREAPHDHAEREGDHQEVGAGGADRHEAEERRRGRGQQHAGDQTREESGLTLGGEDADGVGGGAEVGGVAERGQAGVAQQDVEAHGEDGHDGDLREQRERIRRQQRRHGARGDEGGDADDDRPDAHTRPKRPVGLSARISAIGAKSVK